MMKKVQKRNRIRKNVISFVAGIFVTGCMLTGCGSSKMTESITYDNAASVDTSMYSEEPAEVYAEEIAYDDSMSMEMKDAGEGNAQETGTLEENASVQERKLIKTVDLYAETEDYDALLSNVEKKVTELGGYVEYKYQYNGSNYSRYEDVRDANLTIRIPVSNLESFIRQVGEEANVTSKEEQVEDVTLQYVDLESRKKTLVTEQERLLTLLAQAETVEDIVTIEERLSQVRYELESMESQLRVLDNQIDYSTVHLNIQEVRKITQTSEQSLIGRLGNGLKNSLYEIGIGLEDGFIWFVIHIPYFVLWIAVIAVIVFVGKWYARHKNQKKAAKAAKKEELLKEAEAAEAEIKAEENQK